MFAPLLIPRYRDTGDTANLRNRDTPIPADTCKLMKTLT